MSQPFDFDKALKALQSGQVLTEKDGILTPLIKQLTETALSAELDSHLAQDVEANRKNGSGKKTIKAPTGSFEHRFFRRPFSPNVSFRSPERQTPFKTGITEISAVPA